jgi:phosphoribosylaminoimidazole-succinocarboxamide synthase
MRKIMDTICAQTDIPELELVCRGKVRDVYAAGKFLVLVATDRLSAFDCVLPDGIPGKGKVLTQLSCFWFEAISDWMPNHYFSTRLEDLPVALGGSREVLEGRTMICHRAQAIPVECVVRGYLAGSGWQEYRKTGSVCGIRLPEGLVENSPLDPPVFTPATKASTGHDENISFQEMEKRVGSALAAEMREASLRIFSFASALTASRGLILSDTKFEFGLLDGRLLVIDELLTPDSSRYWDKSSYCPGRTPHSFDKQFVRDYLIASGWNKEPPAPKLSADVIGATSERYLLAYRLLTGREISI